MFQGASAFALCDNPGRLWQEGAGQVHARDGCGGTILDKGDDVNNCTVNCDGPFNVINARTQGREMRLEQPEAAADVNVSEGRIGIGGRLCGSDEVIVIPDEPYIFNLDGMDYRGKLKLIVNPEDNCFDAINLVPLEAYLAGVVGAEMPDYWEPAALEAQAIAARTYCLHIKRRFGSRRAWDVRKTQAHQVYRGVSAESAAVWEVVNKTRGQVLMCNQGDGAQDIFPTYYSSICGGSTENSKYVFGDSFEPLGGVDCDYCKEVAKPNFYFWPTVHFDKADVTSRLFERYPTLEQLGEVTDLIPTRQSDYEGFSRLTMVRIVGLDGKRDVLRAEDLRLAIDASGRKIRSAICKIVDMDDKWAFTSGRGFGHGVGMCQCGAQALARRGESAERILGYYYPSSRIEQVYQR
jgi:stage II sporulation protein D